MKPTLKYCAIYTRKSSEEGLEQDFNSLDAQRESCLSYIQSQKSEGWQALRNEYNDGGFSGGNMDRPGLKKLLDDIAAKKVHIVVVYKIDRLTRSLMDFSKLVEIFDKHGVTFVSVTQSFNTTTSMGRLTLNVLLSFAQFEREVTGERIRDKIAASKQKGMWMGGATPIGFDCIERKLVINQEEAVVIKTIFEKYLDLGCVRKLKHWLDVNGYCTKIRKSQKGRVWGGMKFSRGLLYKILINPVYIGQIKHKDKVYDGQHQALLSKELWDQVQRALSEKSMITRGSEKTPPYGNLLKSKIADCFGNKYSPTFTSKGKRQYRYYVSQVLLQNREAPIGIISRLHAHDAEKMVENAIFEQASTHENLANLLSLEMSENKDFLNKITAQKAHMDFRYIAAIAVDRMEIGVNNFTITISPHRLLKYFADHLKLDCALSPAYEFSAITVPIGNIKQKHSPLSISETKPRNPNDPFDRDPQELKDWVRGIIWRDQHFQGMTIRAIAARENCSESLVAKMIQYSFVAA